MPEPDIMSLTGSWFCNTVDVYSREADQVREGLDIALGARFEKSLIDVHCH